MCVKYTGTVTKERTEDFECGSTGVLLSGDWKVPLTVSLSVTLTPCSGTACTLDVKRGRAPRKHLGQNGLLRHDWYHKERPKGRTGRTLCGHSAPLFPENNSVLTERWCIHAAGQLAANKKDNKGFSIHRVAQKMSMPSTQGMDGCCLFLSCGHRICLWKRSSPGCRYLPCYLLKPKALAYHSIFGSILNLLQNYTDEWYWQLTI